jgi:hypothetical protein
MSFTLGLVQHGAASLRNDEMSAIEASARMTLISRPDSGCVYLPVRGEPPEVKVFSARVMSGIVGQNRLLVREGRNEGDRNGYIGGGSGLSGYIEYKAATTINGPIRTDAERNEGRPREVVFSKPR